MEVRLWFLYCHGNVGNIELCEPILQSQLEQRQVQHVQSAQTGAGQMTVRVTFDKQSHIPDDPQWIIGGHGQFSI